MIHSIPAWANADQSHGKDQLIVSLVVIPPVGQGPSATHRTLAGVLGCEPGAPRESEPAKWSSEPSVGA